MERHGDRSGLAEIAGAAAAGSLTGDVNAAATAAMVAAPKATRSARESFASTLGARIVRAPPDAAAAAEALRRLDRVDAVLIDPRALWGDDLRVSRIRGAPEADRAAIWQWAHGQLRVFGAARRVEYSRRRTGD